MAQKRPGYERNTTDRDNDIPMAASAQGRSSLSKDWTQDDGGDGKTATAKVLRSGSPSDDDLPAFEGFDEEAVQHQFGVGEVISTAEEVVTHVIHVDDDPSLSPWTIRVVLIGVGIACFASVLQEIFYFKPQVIFVSVNFLTVVAYPFLEFLAFAIPRKGVIGKWLNPFPFNSKEHAAVAIMASASATSAVATEILAAQKLYYNENPQPGAAIFLVLSSQLFGFGIAGLMRNALVRPTKLLWPMNLPINTILEVLHRDKKENKKRLKVFWMVFGCMFIWEIVPEWIMPLLQGVSIFCLANRHSSVFTNIFGGSQGNEGMGFLSICLDWNYIASIQNPLWIPLITQLNSLVGYLLCIVGFSAIFYGNVWESRNFPFLSQLLYNLGSVDGQPASNGTYFSQYNLTAILGDNYEINKELYAANGTPYLTGSYVFYLITTNMGFTATFVHLFLWNWEELKGGFMWARPSALRVYFQPGWWKFWTEGESEEAYIKRMVADEHVDPHYKLMLTKGYKEVPSWWYGAVYLGSFAVAMGTLYAIDSTLPWWGLIMSNIFAAIFILFFGVQFGVTGFGFNLQPVIQMLAGYLHPYKPVANMYFTVFGYNGQAQGVLMARDLKLAQYAHLSFKATFFFQILGAVVGAILNYVMMQSIVNNQFEILKSIEGSNIWSGANVQGYYTLAIAWSVAGDMFSVGARYQWVTISYLLGFIVPLPFYFAYRYTKIEFFRYCNLAIILWYMGWLVTGVNSSIGVFFVLGIGAQWWLRKYHPATFVKYNYLVAAALDGGTQVCVFILSFAVAGGSGVAHNFPIYWGNNRGVAEGKNIDYCYFQQ